jgi:hypothetical protein
MNLPDTEESQLPAHRNTNNPFDMSGYSHHVDTLLIQKWLTALRIGYFCVKCYLHNGFDYP